MAEILTFTPLALLLLSLLSLFLPVTYYTGLSLAGTLAAFIASFFPLFTAVPSETIAGLHLTALSEVMLPVICFISLLVQAYARRHFDGSQYRSYAFKRLVGLTLALCVFITADHLLLIIAALGSSNYLLTRLIAVNRGWSAARFSARSALIHLDIAMILLGLAAGLIYLNQGGFSLQQLVTPWTNSVMLGFTASLIIVASLMQSAIWPFHRWLIASANAPTPVSAFMHAGLVNGGALILYIFYPLISQVTWSSSVLLGFGAATAFTGTLWMLVQSDVKRTLTCSTMGQMGFMILQCGLGLYPAAIAHMIWHGFFKASLFMSAGTAIKAAPNRSLSLQGPGSMGVFVTGIVTGTAGAGVFWWFTSTLGSLNSTYLLLLIFCGITCAHAVMTLLHTKPDFTRGILAASIGLFGSAVYGLAVSLIERHLMVIQLPQLEIIHLVLAGIFVLGWVLMLFRMHLPGSIDRYLVPLYVRLLNSSQPTTQTLTNRRSDYSL